jgi:hypothetical protein
LKIGESRPRTQSASEEEEIYADRSSSQGKKKNMRGGGSKIKVSDQ